MKTANPRHHEPLKALARAMRYKKHSLFLFDASEVALSGGYWDGGSRAQWYLYDAVTKRAKPLAAPTAPTQHGGARPPVWQIEPATYVVKGGVSCGKPAFLSVFGHNAETFFTE